MLREMEFGSMEAIRHTFPIPPTRIPAATSALINWVQITFLLPARRINFIWTICGFTVSILDCGRRSEYSEPNLVHVKITCLAGNTLILHGGTATTTSTITWHYSIDENRWLEKENFVHLDYSDTCTDDVVAIENDPSCIELEFPDDLRRSNATNLALKYQDNLSFSQQEGYTPECMFV